MSNANIMKHTITKHQIIKTYNNIRLNNARTIQKDV